jgi:hypothetical protein
MKRESRVEVQISTGEWFPKSGLLWNDLRRGMPVRIVERYVTEWAPVEGEAGA